MQQQAGSKVAGKHFYQFFTPVQRTGLFFLLLLIVVEFIAVLVVNRNNFCYTLDDPYIHLALAENIAGGHYGINLHENSAPSSSIIWPLILALFAQTGFFTFVPFFINVLAAAGTVMLFGRISEQCIPSATTHVQLKKSAFVVLLLLCSNTVGLVFTGMEHSLQLFLSLLVVTGLIDEARSGEVRMATWLGIALGPLVRYECFAVSFAALAVLFIRRHRGGACLTCIATVLPAGLFSLFLVNRGLLPLPTSIMAKSAVVPGGGSDSLFSGVLATLTTAVTSSRGLVLLALTLVLGWKASARKGAAADRLLSGGMACAAVIHLLGGKYGSYCRYEVYIWSAGLITLLYVYRAELQRLLLEPGCFRPFVRQGAAALLLLIMCYPYVIAHVTLPIASGNIYRQQYQMRRFAVRYYRRAVGVNDIGLVSYRNRQFVLDYAGLASQAALQYNRLAGNNGMWMDSLAHAHGIRFAMLYREWYDSIPPQWINMGELRFSGPQITPAGRAVTFYAMDSTVYHELVPLVGAFIRTLPDGASFVRPGFPGEKVALGKEW